MNVTLYAIAKNEEKNLERFLKNAEKFDDVVVVDTGSTDNTVQLLKDAGISVYEHPQTREEFDFALARNTALSYVTTDWAFSLDFNEDVDEFIADGLDPIESEFTVFKHLRFDDNGEDEPTQSFEVHNRFHRTANYKWVNAVHEMPQFVSTEKFQEESSVDTTIKITKRLQKSLDKELFYLSICEREHEKDPSNEFYIWFIFNHYLSVSNFPKALEFGQEYLSHSTAYFNPFRIEVFLRCSIILLQTNNIQMGVNYCIHALSESLNFGGELMQKCFAHLLNLGLNIGDPNIITFASSVSEEFKNLPERKSAIEQLYNEIKE
jgi:glycosyltransferase involved in cell wall biosynthesis